jgi:hypothetical protein
MAATTDCSRLKQIAYSRYATGQLTLHEVTDEVSAIHPAVKYRSSVYRVARFMFLVVSALLLPSWATRREGS